MSDQLTLDLRLPAVVMPTDRSVPYPVQAAEFARLNPELIDRMASYALERMAKGRRTSMKNIVERARWDWEDVAVSDSQWSFNNNLTAPLARILMARHPELVGFFETRGDDCSAPGSDRGQVRAM